MEYYNKLKALFQLEDMAEMRLKQLENEHDIDQELKSCAKRCPDQVMQYLFNMRAINRWHAKKIHGKSFLDYPEHMTKAYNDVQSVQRHFWPGDPYVDACTCVLPRMNQVVAEALAAREKSGDDTQPVGDKF